MTKTEGERLCQGHLRRRSGEETTCGTSWVVNEEKWTGFRCLDKNYRNNAGGDSVLCQGYRFAGSQEDGQRDHIWYSLRALAIILLFQ